MVPHRPWPGRGVLPGVLPPRWPQNLRFLRRQPLVCCWLPRRRAACGSKSTTQSGASEETLGFTGEMSNGKCWRELQLSATSPSALAESMGGDSWSSSPVKGVPVSASATRAHVSPGWPPSSVSCGREEEGSAESISLPLSPPVFGSMERSGSTLPPPPPQEAGLLLVQRLRAHPYPCEGSGCWRRPSGHRQGGA